MQDHRPIAGTIRVKAGIHLACMPCLACTAFEHLQRLQCSRCTEVHIHQDAKLPLGFSNCQGRSMSGNCTHCDPAQKLSQSSLAGIMISVSLKRAWRNTRARTCRMCSTHRSLVMLARRRYTDTAEPPQVSNRRARDNDAPRTDALNVLTADYLPCGAQVASFSPICK